MDKSTQPCTHISLLLRLSDRDVIVLIKFDLLVFILSSRPDLLDAALLRPGRLDRLLFCDFPSQHERSEILSVLSRKVSLSSDLALITIKSQIDVKYVDHE